MMNFDWPRLQLDALAVARQIIGALALDLDRGISRRDLLDQAGEPRQQGPDRLRGGAAVAGLDNPALGIVRIAFLAPGDPKAKTPSALHHERHRLVGPPP